MGTFRTAAAQRLRALAQRLDPVQPMNVVDVLPGHAVDTRTGDVIGSFTPVGIDGGGYIVATDEIRRARRADS